MLRQRELGGAEGIEGKRTDVSVHEQIPAGLVVGEDPLLDTARFRRTDLGICLITQPMLDRLRQ